MLQAYLCTGSNPIPKWVTKFQLSLKLNSMPLQSHGYSSSMVTTGQETTLPPDLVMGANPVETEEDPFAYVSKIQEKLREVHRRVTPTVAPTRPNPYEPGNLIWVAILPLERNSKISPKWIGSCLVLKVPNPYQVVYGTGTGVLTVH